MRLNGLRGWRRRRELSAKPAAPAEPDAAPPAATLRLCVFGYPSVYLNDQPVALKQGRRALAVLTTLALDEAGQGCTRDDLLGAALWDEPMGSTRRTCDGGASGGSGRGVPR